MKRKEIRNSKVSGFYINDLIRGFMGDQDEGRAMLRTMGLSDNILPFSVEMFIQNKKANWKDKDGNLVSISFVIKPDQMECFGSYLGKTKSIRMFREWDNHEELETVAKLESEAIGDLCMKCIYNNLM